MTGTFANTQFYLSLFIVFLSAYIHDVTSSRLEPGIEEFVLATKDSGVAIQLIAKNMFKDTDMKISVGEKVNCDDGTKYRVGWELRHTTCAQLYTVKSGQILLNDLPEHPSAMYSVEPEITVMSAISKYYPCSAGCDDCEHPEFPPSDVTTCYIPPESTRTVCEKGTIVDEEKKETLPDDAKPLDDAKPSTDSPVDSRRRKRADGTESTDGGKKPESTDGGNKTESTDGGKKSNNAVKPGPDKYLVANTTTSGSYLLILNITTVDSSGNVSFTVTVDMKGPNGYLSAFQYPLLKFYGIMCGVYTLFGFTWLFLLCRQYQDLLGIQIWIGVVILLGLIEKAAFYGEYEHMNNQGTESTTGVLLAELISCVKRTLARLLVVIVSIGYGITRPRLGTDLNYVMAAGLLYLTLSSAEAIMRVSESYEHSMVAVLPLSVLEAILVWWILRNLVDTTRTLRLRNNETKLWLYRHFTNTLLLCVVFSVIFSIWSMKTHRFNECMEKHYELWLDDAFWHILFCVILFVIMILFRPSANNQRYAYSPLLDEEQEDEESKEPMLSEAYDGMKMRNLKKDNPQNAVKDIADDLKWVEDNIPAAIADSALAIMDDSEEELVTNLERSKMD